jgi:hypothetical protein
VPVSAGDVFDVRIYGLGAVKAAFGGSPVQESH